MHEFEEVAANMASVRLDTPFVSNEEQWVLEDVSPTGYGAFVRNPAGAWITVGRLIGLKRDEGSSWSAGIVKRVSVDERGNRYVGVETLAQGGAAVTITDASAGKETAAASEEVCILLPAEDVTTREALLLMPVDRFARCEQLLMRAYDKSYVLTPLNIVKSGNDFEMARFEIVGEADIAV